MMTKLCVFSRVKSCISQQHSVWGNNLCENTRNIKAKLAKPWADLHHEVTSSWRLPLAGPAQVLLKMTNHGDKPFSHACCEWTRNKMNQALVRWDTRMKSFTMRVMRPWNRLPRKRVGAPSLETFRTRLDRALSNAVKSRCFSMADGRRLEQDEF